MARSAPDFNAGRDSLWRNVSCGATGAQGRARPRSSGGAIWPNVAHVRRSPCPNRENRPVKTTSGNLRTDSAGRRGAQLRHTGSREDPPRWLEDSDRGHAPRSPCPIA